MIKHAKQLFFHSTAAALCLTLALGLSGCSVSASLPQLSQSEASAPQSGSKSGSPIQPQSVEDTAEQALYSREAEDALSMLRGCMDAENGVQSVCAVAYLGYREQNDRSDFSDWLYQNNALML